MAGAAAKQVAPIIFSLRCGPDSTKIGANKPVFADRDGLPKASLADIGDERRNGYAWYGTWPQTLLQVEYPAWKKRLATKAGP